MPRGLRKTTQPKASKKLKPPRCPWCKQHRDARRFDKHVGFCRANHLHRKSARNTANRRSPDGLNSEDNILGDTEQTVNDFSQPVDLEPVDVPGSDIPAERDFIGPLLPGAYFKILPHPHSANPTALIVPLSAAEKIEKTWKGPDSEPAQKPWFPFRTRGDFEVGEIAVKGGLNSEFTDKLLKGTVNKEWGNTNSRVSLGNSTELEHVLKSARRHGVQFKSGSIFATYKKERQEIKFEYRDPWEWISTLLNDESLGPTTMYNSVRKYYCEGTIAEVHCERVIDEPNTADAWARFESELPEPDPYPHCLLPLHFWLDEGLVTKRVTMHPMVLRPVFQPGKIRNASGNGGGVLIGYMTAVRDPSDPNNRNTPETLEFARYKMEVYQKILGVIFAPLKSRSWSGEPIRCPDGLPRVFHPGIIIDSLDGKEASYYNACRAALANFPCPKCLVPHCDLHKITSDFKLRTSATMKAVVLKAFRKKTKADKEHILKKHGLHGVVHFLWEFRFSDPYAAYSYDTLHSDDLGKWGHHLWPLLLKELENLNQKGPLAENMRRFPRWANLKHFNQVTTVHFTDGQSFYDILKCILPCIVQLFPSNNSLVHCIRAYQRYRIMVGMRCMPERRLQRLDEFIHAYERCCSRVTEDYGKDFDFFKQHAVNHVVRDIRDKGTTDHGSTRPGEGFQQEAREAYKHSNGKEAAHQMVRFDETHEAMARIRMNVDNYDLAQREYEEANQDEDLDESPVEPQDSAHWAFGAPIPGRLVNSRAVEETYKNSPAFKNFDLGLREFISDTFPEEYIKFEDTIMIRSFKCVHISYQSLEDWRGARDILRCNPSFHQNVRYDCLLVNSTDPGLHFARLRALIRCHLPSGRQIDIALVRMFEKSHWKPRTQWAGCQVRDEVKQYSFLSMEHIIRGVLMAPVSAAPDDPTHILVDTVDADIFLRADV
ncbi:hypothetical protein DFH06DRAFT_1062143 [Mycena polygramma]|nr:hypothetical protein DFH06DRAFT_1062143 [Mycena polygramma]